ncbi:MAG: hypothetical protein OEW05_11195 [Candidatus Aminicenantes bacterium]|nr:hypothetical protein [Candidatus Aminicenantes bacterium]
MDVLSYIITLLFAGFAGVAGATKLIRAPNQKTGDIYERCPKPYLFLLWLAFILGILGWLGVKYLLLKFDTLDALNFLAGLGGAYLLPHFLMAWIWCPDPLRKRS